MVAGDKLGDAERVGRVEWFDRECARGEVAEESDFGLPAESCADQVGDFGDHEDRDDQRAGVALEQVEAGVVVRVVGVDIRIEWPCVDD